MPATSAPTAAPSAIPMVRFGLAFKNSKIFTTTILPIETISPATILVVVHKALRRVIISGGIPRLRPTTSISSIDCGPTSAFSSVSSNIPTSLDISLISSPCGMASCQRNPPCAAQSRLANCHKPIELASLQFYTLPELALHPVRSSQSQTTVRPLYFLFAANVSVLLRVGSSQNRTAALGRKRTPSLAEFYRNQVVL